MIYLRTDESKISGQALSALRHEVRAARLRVSLDKKLGRETSRRVKRLSEIDLPPVVRRFRLAGVAQTGAGARKTVEVGRGCGRAVPADVVRQPALSVTEKPAVVHPYTGDETRSSAEAKKLRLESSDQPMQNATATVATGTARPDSKIEPADAEHSGYVTLYLPRGLNRWLGAQHDSSGVSYPEIVLNAIPVWDCNFRAFNFATLESTMALPFDARCDLCPSPAECRDMGYRDSENLVLGVEAAHRARCLLGSTPPVPALNKSYQFGIPQPLDQATLHGRSLLLMCRSFSPST